MEYLTCEQVAEIAHCSVYHIREAVKDGALKAYKPGKSLLFTPDDVRAWIEASAVQGREGNESRRVSVGN